MDGALQETLVLVLTTESTLEKANKLSETLLERGLVACVAVMPIVSTYKWQGRTTRSEEVQLLLKTKPHCLEALYQAVMSLHSYDTPEWITLAAHTRGGYGQWCFEQLRDTRLRADGEPPAPATNPEVWGPTG